MTSTGLKWPLTSINYDRLSVHQELPQFSQLKFQQHFFLRYFRFPDSNDLWSPPQYQHFLAEISSNLKQLNLSDSSQIYNDKRIPRNSRITSSKYNSFIVGSLPQCMLFVTNPCIHSKPWPLLDCRRGDTDGKGRLIRDWRWRSWEHSCLFPKEIKETRGVKLVKRKKKNQHAQKGVSANPPCHTVDPVTC